MYVDESKLAYLILNLSNHATDGRVEQTVSKTIEICGAILEGAVRYHHEGRKE